MIKAQSLATTSTILSKVFETDWHYFSTKLNSKRSSNLEMTSTALLIPPESPARHLLRARRGPSTSWCNRSTTMSLTFTPNVSFTILPIIDLYDQLLNDHQLPKQLLTSFKNLSQTNLLQSSENLPLQSRRKRWSEKEVQLE